MRSTKKIVFRPRKVHRLTMENSTFHTKENDINIRSRKVKIAFFAFCYTKKAPDTLPYPGPKSCHYADINPNPKRRRS